MHRQTWWVSHAANDMRSMQHEVQVFTRPMFCVSCTGELCRGDWYSRKRWNEGGGGGKLLSQGCGTHMTATQHACHEPTHR